MLGLPGLIWNFPELVTLEAFAFFILQSVIVDWVTSYGPLFLDEPSASAIISEAMCKAARSGVRDRQHILKSHNPRSRDPN